MVAEGLGLPLESAAINVPSYGNLGVSDAGIVIFSVPSYTYIASNPTRIVSGAAMCTSNGLEVTPIAHTIIQETDGDIRFSPAPDQASSGFENAIFSDFLEHTTVSPSGRMLFQGEYTNGTGTYGIYLSINGGAPVRVVDNRPDLTVPGLPEDAQIGTADEPYDAFAISANDHIAIEAPIVGGGDTRAAVILWDFAINEWTELKTSGGEQVIELLSGITDGGALLGYAGSALHLLDRTSSVSIAANAGSAFSGVPLSWSRTRVGAVNNLGHAIVPYTRSAVDVDGLGFWSGERLLILADSAAGLPEADFATATIASQPTTDRPGRSGALSDTDAAVFLLERQDGTQTVYLGQAE
jgi:hypothetical protein